MSGDNGVKKSRLVETYKLVLNVMPIYGAYHSEKAYGEIWTGLCGGLLIMGFGYSLFPLAKFIGRLIGRDGIKSPETKEDT